MRNLKLNDVVATLMEQTDELTVGVTTEYTASTQIEVDWGIFFTKVLEFQRAVHGRSQFSGLVIKLEELSALVPGTWRNKSDVPIADHRDLYEAYIDTLTAHQIAFPMELSITQVLPELSRDDKVFCHLIPDITAEKLDPNLPEYVNTWNDTSFTDVFEVIRTDYFTYFPDNRSEKIRNLLNAVTLYSFYCHKSTPFSQLPYTTEFTSMTRNGLFLEVCANMDISPTMSPLWLYTVWSSGLDYLFHQDVFSPNPGNDALMSFSIGTKFFPMFTAVSDQLWRDGIGHGWKGFTGDVYHQFSKEKK